MYFCFIRQVTFIFAAQLFLLRHILKNIFYCLPLSCLLLASACCLAQAQADTAVNKAGQPAPMALVPDTAAKGNAGNGLKVPATAVTVKKGPFQPNPKRAGLYSAIVPGLGQFYNRQYWKVPVIYAGLAVAGYFINDNLTNYRAFRKAYIGRINNPYPTDKYLNIYSSSQLQQLQNEYSKFLNLTVLFTGVGYTLQILEAMTGAHLKNFDVSRDISMHVQPVAFPKAVGMGLVFNFK